MEKTVYKIEELNYWSGESIREEEFEVSSRGEAIELYAKKYHPDTKPSVVEMGLTVSYVSGYKDETKTIRCVPCGAEFTDMEIEGATSCPGCGSVGIPMEIKNDVEVKINWHELRILSIWAENWGRQIDRGEEDESKKTNLYTIMSIAQRLQDQHPDKTKLTLFSEVRELRKDYEVETNLDDDSTLGL